MAAIDDLNHVSVKYNESYLLKVIRKFSLHLKLNSDRKIEWLVVFKELKCRLFEIFGDYGNRKNS